MSPRGILKPPSVFPLEHELPGYEGEYNNFHLCKIRHHMVNSHASNRTPQKSQSFAIS